jgi:hypothetical protein
MELSYKKTAFIHRSYGMSGLHDYEAKIYEVKPLKRCFLFDDCNKKGRYENNNNDNFNDLLTDEIPDEYESSEMNEEEMKKTIAKAKEKFDTDNKEHIERKYTLIVDHVFSNVLNNDEIKTIIVKKSVDNLTIDNCKNLESIKFDNKLYTLKIMFCKNLILPETMTELYIHNCENLINIVFGKKVSEINIKFCNSLQILNISGTQSKILDIYKCNMESLILNDDLINLKVQNCINLNNIVFGKNLRYIKLYDCGIKNLNMESNNRLELHFSECKNLQQINIKNFNHIDSIHFSNLPEIIGINISCESDDEKLTESVVLRDLNIVNMPILNFSIAKLILSDCNKISSLDIPQNVEALHIENKYIREINIKGNVILTLYITADNLHKLFFEECKYLDGVQLSSKNLEYITGKLSDSITYINLKCEKLKSIPNIPLNLEVLECIGCKNLTLPESNVEYALIKKESGWR